jgi:hypothetical protein
MRYWWVNQNQTYRHEIEGGYLWSPKRKTNNQRNRFYESMRDVAPGDVIFFLIDTRIAPLGIARSYCGPIGWKVDVSFQEVSNRIRPKDHIALIPRRLWGFEPTQCIRR